MLRERALLATHNWLRPVAGRISFNSIEQVHNDKSPLLHQPAIDWRDFEPVYSEIF